MMSDAPKGMMISVCIYKNGDFDAIIEDAMTHEQITLSGQQTLDRDQLNMIGRLAPGCVMTRYSHKDAKSGPSEAADTIEALRERVKELEGLLWYGWNEMNAIRAESGVPRSYDGTTKGISEEYWSSVVDKMRDALGDDATPWPSEAARDALGDSHE